MTILRPHLPDRPHIGILWCLVCIALLCVALALTGCRHLEPLLDAWRAAATNAPATPAVTNAPADPAPADPAPDPDPATADAVAFADLRWSFGGFNGAQAALDAPRIAALKLSASGLSYSWAGADLSAWGLADGDAGALACFFVRRSDGAWHGGKFDWISTSRRTRSFTNIHGGYNGWSLSGVPNPCPAAFVVVSSNGRKRTNVIVGEWRR